ncbi:MAG: DNA primase [Xanthobacteraceae bacterium]
MGFPPSFLDELRARIPVSEVVGQKVKLRKQGREWRGLSPFNKEKTPSFFVNDQKGFYHDFSSGKSGDQFTFLMETEGLSFPEAVERLAARAGVPIPKISRDLQAHEQRRKTLYDVLDMAAKFFETILASSRGAKARGYLADREILPATQVEFRIGYATSERYALKEYLGAQGIPVSDMIEAGLIIAGDDIPVPYDRFRDRIIIPIHDQRGRIIAFGGRALSSDAPAKYLNSPETPVFRKGETVFNFHRARGPARDESLVIAVEGYLDAISVYQSGLKGVVAIMGTALTEEQIEALWRLAPEPVICLDGDSAGLAAAGRSLDRILPHLRTGVSFRFSFLPVGTDPDEIVRKYGIDRFKATLGESIPLWDMLWERELNKRSIQTPDHKAQFEKDVLELVDHIGDKRVRDSYRFRAKAQLIALFKSLDWQAAITQKAGKASAARTFARNELITGLDGLLVGIEKILLGTLIEYPMLLDMHLEQLMATELTGRLENFKREIYRIVNEFHDVQVSTFYKEIQDDFAAVLEDVHGRVDQKTNQVMATNLYRRFPLLKWDPPVEFVDKAIGLFFAKLHVRQVANELKESYSNPENMTDEAELERVTSLARYLVEETERVAALDRDLAEQASQIRRPLGINSQSWAMAAA